MKYLSGKKLLILGGNWETAKLVQVANSLDVHTIVVDPNPSAPAKKFAADHFEIDGFDVEGIVAVAKKMKVDGVLVGVADVLVNSYQQVCQQLRLPCYASPSSVRAFTGKDGFRHVCEAFGVQDIPGILIDGEITLTELDKLKLPVMVKPVDNGGGLGMRICNSRVDLESCMKFAMEHSRNSKILVERYMTGDDMFAYYTFKDGNAYLSATADRITAKSQEGLSPVCVAARYPSKHTAEFRNVVHPKLIRMFKGLGIRDGILNIQFFVQDGTFFAYDPGFRLQGEAPHFYLKHIFGFDHREMLINFALTGSMDIDNFKQQDSFDFAGQFAGTFWVLLKSGIIHEISGLDAIARDPSVVTVIQRFFEGDQVRSEMLGTERQVLARIYVVTPTLESLVQKSQQLQSLIKVNDEQGDDMVLEWVDAKSFMQP